MIPRHMAGTWRKLERLLAKGQAQEAAELLLILAGAQAELVRVMHDELVAAVEHAALATRRLALYGAFDRGPGYPLRRPSWRVEVVRRADRTVRYTRNDDGDIVEVCLLDERGRVREFPVLRLDPARRRGAARFRAMADSFAGDRAVAGTMYSDDPIEAPVTYEAWRDAYLRWFEE